MGRVKITNHTENNVDSREIQETCVLEHSAMQNFAEALNYIAMIILLFGEKGHYRYTDKGAGVDRSSLAP